MRIRATAFLAAVLAAGRVAGNDAQGDAFMGPLSVSQLGSGGLYGTYDLGKVFENPSLLSVQPRSFAAEFGTQLRFGGEQQLTTAAVGWVGEPGDLGTFGAALLLARLSAPEIAELDALGSPTGLKLSPSINYAGLALLYQWGFFSLGGGAGIGNVDLGSLDVNEGPATTVPALNFGTNLALGRLDLGVGFRMAGGMEGALLQGGLAFRTSGWFKGAIGVSANFNVGQNNNNGGNNNGGSGGPGNIFPSNGSNESFHGHEYVGGGVTWDVLRLLTIRAGLLGNPGGLYVSSGFSVPWRGFSFDYALQMPIQQGGAGVANAFGVAYAFGHDRTPAKGPRFFTKEADRTLAVATFDPQNVSAGDAAVISDMLRNQLIKEGAFNIVEKANMDKVLNEQAFQQTGCTTQECAVKLGKVLNVKYLVVGTFGKALDQFVVSMRVIEVETARAVYSDESYGKDLPSVRDGITRLAANLTEAVNKAK